MPDWNWYVGDCEECYSSGPYDTREEAVEIARTEFGPGGYIIEAYKENVKLSSRFDVGRFLEDANEWAYEECGNEDGLFEISVHEHRLLNLHVRQAIDKWQADHGLTFTPWYFTESRNHDFIKGAEEDE